MAKTILLVASGFVVGALAAVPASLLFLRTDAGQAVLRGFVVSQPQGPDVTTLVQTETGSAFTVSDLFTKTIGVRVAKSYASEEYAAALNGLISDIQKLGTTSDQLGPLLMEMNSRSLVGNFDGFFDLVVRAKMLVAEQRTLYENFSVHLTDLAIANQSTTDTTTKSLTLAVLASAEPVKTRLATYIQKLELMLSGSVPSSDLIRD